MTTVYLYKCPKCGETPEIVTSSTYECVDCSTGGFEDLERVEKPSSCSHELNRTKMTRNPQKDGTMLIAHCEIKNKFCPECGESLET